MTKKKKKKTVSLFKVIIVCSLILIISCVCVFFSAKKLKFGLDLQGGFEVLYKVDSIDGSKVTSDMVTSTYKIIENRIDILGVSEPEIAIEGNNIRVTMAGITNIEEARNTISTTANLTFRNTSGELLMTSDVLNNTSYGYNATNGYYVSLSIKDKDTFYEKTKEVSKLDDNYIVIWLDYDESYTLTEGANSNGRASQGYYTTDEEGNSTFHACGDDNSACLSYAGVSQGFSSDVIISGSFTKDEVVKLSELINSGSMPTKLTEISSKTVTAKFGEDSLSKTFKAGIIGIALIVLLLIILYKVSGVIASISIISYTGLTLLIFNLVEGRLSLQGIAALVIGIGMAVDSAVITYSRIKEELKRGVSLSTAYTSGSKESFVSILDANITTLIAAIILFIFGESSVKGFSTMLIISIIVTFIVMVYLNKFLIKLFVKTEKFEKHLKAFIGFKKTDKEHKINFTSKKNMVFTIVGLIIALGLVFTYFKGLNLGIDFKGGSTIEVNSEQKLVATTIKSDLEELEYKVDSVEQVDDSRVYATIKDVLDNENTNKVEEYFSEKYEATTSVGAISNQVKKDITLNAIKALIYACIGMILYVSIRFKFSYGVSAILALAHDSVMVLIIFSLLRLEVNSMFIAAILSIIGYSINNTIVVFDRIRENKTKLYKDKIKKYSELEDIVNISLNQTIVRCLITTITTLLPVICLIFIGSREILNFNIALLIGLVVGTFSSLFISSQIWMTIEKRKIGKDPNKHWYDDNKHKEKEELQVKGINC